MDDPSMPSGTVPHADVRQQPDDVSQLMQSMYAELRRLAGAFLREQPADHTLQPTALVHEAFLRLARQTDAQWDDDTHFLAVAATVMRRLLVNHAERRMTLKRGGDRLRLSIDEARDAAPTSAQSSTADVLSLHRALEELAEHDARKARVVELRWFGGLTHAQIARVLDVSHRTVDSDWSMARAWLSKALDADDVA